MCVRPTLQNKQSSSTSLCASDAKTSSFMYHLLCCLGPGSAAGGQTPPMISGTMHLQPAYHVSGMVMCARTEINVDILAEGM